MNTAVFQLQDVRPFTPMKNEIDVGMLFSSLLSNEHAIVPVGTVEQMKFPHSDEGIEGDTISSVGLLIIDMAMDLESYNSNLKFVEPFFLKKLFEINSAPLCVDDLFKLENVPTSNLLENDVDSIISLGWILHARLDRAMYLSELLSKQFDVGQEHVLPFLRLPIFQEFCLTGGIRISPRSKGRYDLNEVALRGGKYFRNGRSAEQSHKLTKPIMDDIVQRFHMIHFHVVQLFDFYERTKPVFAESFYIPRSSTLMRNYLLTSKIARFYPDTEFDFRGMTHEDILMSLTRDGYNPRYKVRYVVPKIEFLMNLIYISRVAHDLDNNPELPCAGYWLSKQPENPCMHEAFMCHLLFHHGGKPLF
jgi:hypothetical protein